jgi:uncharacterized protein YndB with AHSA1/START domain
MQDDVDFRKPRSSFRYQANEAGSSKETDDACDCGRDAPKTVSGNSLQSSPETQRSELMKMTVETLVNAPVAKVWSAYTTPEDIKQWNTASDDWHTTKSTVDLRVGGQFSSRMEAKDGSFGFDFAGTYTKIVPNKLIEYAFGDRAGVVEFVPAANGVTVRVTFDAETTHPVEQQRQGWQAILNNFAKLVVAKDKAAK